MISVTKGEKSELETWRRGKPEKNSDAEPIKWFNLENSKPSQRCICYAPQRRWLRSQTETEEFVRFTSENRTSSKFIERAQGFVRGKTREKRNPFVREKSKNCWIQTGWDRCRQDGTGYVENTEEGDRTGDKEL
ncbi:Hypothetical protein NTJ_09881 [Nesidiocoris tenuis]|uniref:Uncharacterized protein n=1 Tax=Nesidiocoris tenuis TaxID=355587 RepID=A0ABN7B093_9HEMI|nr:Hypothetical protein NTJ_09881 [Nesidiocoris tenuis]